MVIHNVYFWLKPGLSDRDIERFVEGARRLLDIETVTGGYVARPAPTEARAIVDHSFDYALFVLFEDIAAHDAYQDHPIHDAFRELAPLWDRVVVYDAGSI